MSQEITFHAACLSLERILAGDARKQVLDRLSKSKKFKEALSKLRDGMRAHQLFSLEKIVNVFERRTAEDGFHPLRDWDGKAEKLNEELIPIDVLHFYMTTPREGPPDRTILSIFVDYYLIYLLAVFCLRVWDEGSANENLDRVTELINLLQGPEGSGHRFVANAETLMLIATSHFEPDEKAYERLLAKVKSLDSSHQVRVALAHAAILGGHLRHGFQDLYAKDLTLMRNDNGPDYPWLCFSVVVLMRAYAGMRDEGIDGIERERVVEGILNAMTPDARAFLGKLPAPLVPHESEILEFRGLFHRYKEDLLREFETHRPSDRIYSPLTFNFNFPHNVLKALVIDALLEAEGVKLTLNDLLSGVPRNEELRKQRQALASTLMKFARFIPDSVKGRAVPVMNYDPQAGLLSFAKTLTIIKDLA
jgi:hypothetical protein